MKIKVPNKGSDQCNAIVTLLINTKKNHIKIILFLFEHFISSFIFGFGQQTLIAMQW